MMATKRRLKVAAKRRERAGLPRGFPGAKDMRFKAMQMKRAAEAKQDNGKTAHTV